MRRLQEEHSISETVAGCEENPTVIAFQQAAAAKRPLGSMFIEAQVSRVQDLAVACIIDAELSFSIFEYTHVQKLLAEFNSRLLSEVSLGRVKLILNVIVFKNAE